MRHHPFSLLRPFADRIDVRLYEKVDALHSDADLEKALGNPHLATVEQVHGNTTTILRVPRRRKTEADGILSDSFELTLSSRSADCQTFCLYAPEARIIGVLHAGWRGLVSGAIAEWFSVLRATWNIDPATVYVGAAPSLCTACSEFSDPAKELAEIDPRFFHGRNVDLRGIAEDQMQRFGLSTVHFERMSGCTRCDSNVYYTYRGDKNSVLSGARNVLTIRQIST